MEENKNVKREVENVEVIQNKQSFSKKEIEDGKLMGILSYIGILSLIPYFTEKNNKFVMYHAKQGLNLFLLEMICSVAISIVGSLLWLLFWLVGLVSTAVGVASLVLSVMGIVSVCKGEAKELPYIGKFKLVK